MQFISPETKTMIISTGMLILAKEEEKAGIIAMAGW